MAKKTNQEITVKKSLQETVASHPNVAVVYFDERGNHYFNVHEYHGTNGKGKLVGLYGHIHVRTLKSNDGIVYEEHTPNATTLIVSQLTRDEVLNASTVSDLEINLGNLSPDEISAIQSMRQ